MVDDAPERMCAVTRRVSPPEGLIRFVAGPDRAVVPDLRRKLPGRGVWVTATAEAVREAVRRKVFGRGLRAEAVPAPDLAERVEALLLRDGLQSLSLANKAGKVVTGFDKVEAALRVGQALAVLHAREAAPDGRRKLAQAAHRSAMERGAEAAKLISPFLEEEMGLALGRSHVIHAALIAGAVSESCLSRCRALMIYRGFGTEPEGSVDPGHDDTTNGEAAQEATRAGSKAE